MKTYQEVIEILKRQVSNAYQDGASNPLYNVSEQFGIVATIYGVTEEQILADVKA